MNVGMMVRGEPTFPPATPYGVVELLLRSGVELEGAEVVVVGYGELVGAPLSIMLAQDSIRGNATVTCCHVKTRDLATHTRRADILVAAAGVPEMITGDMIKPGATVIDVGVHRTAEGLVGDVRFDEAVEVAGAITPVPGGVGPDDRRDAPGEHRRRRRGAGVRIVTAGGRLAAILAAGEFCVTGEVVPPRSGDGAAVTEHARGLVGYVDAANVTDNPTASAHMSPLAGVRVRGRGGHRAHGAAHVPRPEPPGHHRGPAGGVGARRPQPPVPDGRSD